MRIFALPLSHFLTCSLSGLCSLLLLLSTSARAAFVSETPTEFLASGYFNSDANADVLVLDKATGVARVGYQNGAGELTWSTPFPTGVENVSGCAVGKFLQVFRDSLAVTSTDYNRVPLIDVVSASTPYVATLTGIGPHTLVGMEQPFGSPPGSRGTLLVASAFNSPPTERLELLIFSPGPANTTIGAYNETGSFERGNALQIATNYPTFATGIVRGDTNDALHLWQFTNAPSVLAVLSNLPPGSDYAFGRFNNEPLPRFWLYVPGGTNITIRSLVATGAGFDFGAATTLTFTQAVERVYVVGASNDASAMIQFGDGIQGARLPGGSPQLAAKYANGGGASGNVFTGIAELDNGRFALFSAPTGTVSSLSAQVITFDGTNYTQISSNSLPAVSTRNTRATVWLFQSEPFTNPAATLIASLNVPDWSSGVAGLPGSLSVRAENDSGAASGLGNLATNNLGAPPAGTTYALPDQYRDDISFFTYAPPRPAEPVVITIAPPPGAYGGPIQISFSKQNAAHQVLYRIGMADSWKLYSTPFALTNDATIQYYGNIPAGTRGRLQFATYTMGRTNDPGSTPVKLPGSATNPPPVVNPNVPHISAGGTVFYGRRGINTETTIYYTANDVVKKFTPPGPATTFATLPLFTSPQGLAFDTSGNLFVAGGGNISKITPDGVVSVFATLPPGFGYGMAIDAANNLYVAASSSFEIKKVTPDGAVSTYATLTSGHTGMAVDSSGNVYTLASTTVLKLPSGGGPASIYATLPGPNTYGLAFDSFGYLYVSDLTSVNLYKIPPGGGSYTPFGTLIAGSDGLAFDSSGNLYAAHLYADAISMITPSGTASVFGSSLSGPRYLAFKPDPFALQSNPFIKFGYDPRLPSIWAINLDGSGETFITSGREPRVSRDGRWMAFWRENDPATNQFSLWLRDLPTGQETRWHTRSNRFVGCDWQMDNTHLIFAVDGLFWRIGVSEPPVAFPLSSDPRQGAPAVNPADGRVALQVIHPGSTGLYLAPSNLTSRQNLGLNILSPRWPAWSPNGQRVAIADDPNISPAIDAGRDLWVVSLGAQTNVHQITALSGNNGFPNGAVWATSGDKLVGAGRLFGTNGLWVVPLTPNLDACAAPPQRLPTSLGGDIDFAGSVVANSVNVSYTNLGLFIRLEPGALVVYWSTNYDGFKLESATELPPGLLWSAVNGPYFRAGPNFEYRESRAALATQKYFRLHYPGVLILTPAEPEMEFHLEPNTAVLNWPLNYVGYALEAATNLAPPILWTPLGGAYAVTNGVFEYRRSLPGRTQEFYRLRWR